MTSHSDVNIDALANFGKDLSSMLEHYGDGAGGPFSKIGSVMPGMSGTSEAQTFSDWYAEGLLEPLNYFMQDSLRGLVALSYGAIIAAANYREADLSQAQAIAAVVKAFHPDPGKPSVTSPSGTTGKNTPPQVDTNGQLPSSSTNPWTCNSGTLSVDGQVAAHNQLYGPNEHWTPAPPPPPPWEPPAHMPDPEPVPGPTK